MPERSSQTNRDAAADSVRHVTVVELASAAGHGAVVDSEQVTGRVAFRRSWLTRHGITAAQCSVIRVVGESMEPTLPDGASILVDRNRRRRRVDHIFVVRTEDGLIVKRLGKTTAGAWRTPERQPRQDGMADTALAGYGGGHRGSEVGGPDVRVGWTTAHVR